MAKRLKRLDGWGASHNTDMASWAEIFKLVHETVIETRLKVFQYKLLLRILPKNNLLRLMNSRSGNLTFVHSVIRKQKL